MKDVVRSMRLEDIPPQDIIPSSDGDEMLIFDRRWARDPKTYEKVPLYRKVRLTKRTPDSSDDVVNPWPHEDPLLDIA